MSATSSFGDQVQPFQIETFGVRGRLVRLGPALDRVLERHGYPAPVAAMLAETLALAAALASGLKFDGIFTLQAQGDGPVGVMVADVTSGGEVRGYARFDGARLAEAEDGPGGPLRRLLGAGHLAFTVDQGPATERYQGITELTGATLSDCAHNYFRRSEQLETAIALAAETGAAGGARAAALVIQRLPEDNGGPPPRADEDGDDDWRQAVILTSSVTPEEMLDPGIAPNDLLYRLYHREGVRVYRPRPLRHACRCSREKVAATLRAFPRPEVEAMAEDRRVTVTCEFCKAAYVFDEADVERLYVS